MSAELEGEALFLELLTRSGTRLSLRSATPRTPRIPTRLRALSHAYPMPMPWTTGVYDGGGLDDVLQTIRISYTSGLDVRHVVPDVLRAPTGLVTVPQASLHGGTALSPAHSRAPPLA